MKILLLKTLKDLKETISDLSIKILFEKYD